MKDDDDNDMLMTGIVIAFVMAVFASTPHILALMK